ncbi:glycosyltransferase involved in cell wall biosynthesis [Frondihabitans australicus]|uniref:Glycosyltransferase involved in cell wall biosynthesis n=2 Tax=Frondihabitans australicus TaxID=386892 RepID=A0A495IDY8_9MICO|nr:glycosyltransferase family 1 protein [Frondihabitans australicus]RKR73226.1 glycosyltransferase involved in cell wall biosynthesis [Frondihabitans australicus]
MMTLRVVVDQMLAPVPGGIGRYTEELTKQIIQVAPRGCDVEGIVSAHPQEDYDRLEDKLPGLASLYRSVLGRRELSIAWQTGTLGLPGRGMVHGTSLFTPLYKHDRSLDPATQTAVTIHDTVPWTHPETLTAQGVRWHRAMAKRAWKFADAVVVPTHAVAAELAEYFDFGDRLRVIGGAVSPDLAVPDDADEIADRLDLPERYALSVGTLEPRKGLEPLIRAMAHPDAPDIPLLVVGPEGWGDVQVSSVAEQAGLDDTRVRVMGRVPDATLAALLQRASVFVYPSLAEGFGLPVVEALSLGTPVVHSDAPALVEVAAGAGVVVPRDDPAGYPERLAQAMYQVVNDVELSTRLGVIGLDRARAFSWRDSAEKVWQLHADL